MALTLDKIRERLSYTNRDYASILQNIVSIIQSGEYQTSWNNLSQGDPLMLFIHLLAGHTDVLNNQIDYAVLEGFMSTARERASVIRNANSFGYRIPSYKSAYLEADISGFNLQSARPALLTVGEELTLSPWTVLSGATSNIGWVYIGDEVQFQLDYLYYIKTSATATAYKYVDGDWEVDSNIYIGSTYGGSGLDGALWFDTATNLLKVYSTSTSSWTETTEPYHYGILTEPELIQFGATVPVYQGTAESTDITVSEWALGGGTVIISASNVAIGNNRTLHLLSKVWDSQRVWKQIYNMDRYSGSDLNVYELGVDTAGITYIRFHPEKILDENISINYIVTSGSISSLSDNNLTGSVLYDGTLSAPVLLTVDVPSFIDGSLPLTVEQIRAAFKKYVAYSGTLANLFDYHYYVLNERETVDGINRVNVASTTDSANELVGKPSGNLYEVYVVPSIGISTNLTSEEKVLLDAELSGAPYLNIIIEDPVNSNVGITLYGYPVSQRDRDLVKAELISYVNSKDIGTELTKEEIETMLISKFKSIYGGFSGTLVTALTADGNGTAVTPTSDGYQGAYNCRFILSLSNIS